MQEWKTTALGNVVTFQRGFDLPHRFRKRGSVPVVSSAGVTDHHDAAIVSPPGVVTGRYGTIGQLFFVEEPFWPLNTTLYVRDFHGNDPEFVYHLLHRFDFASFSGKSGVPGVNRNDLHAESVSLPADVAEQRAIATALADVDALLVGLDRLIAKKRDLKQAAMQQLLTGQTRLPGFSGDWRPCPLLSALQISNGQVDPKIEPYRSMVLVGPEHIEGSTGRLIKVSTAADQRAISGKYEFKSGDIIYGKINPHLKKVILAKFDGICSADLYPMRPQPGFSGRFLLAVLLSKEFTDFAVSLSARSGIPKVNREELSGFSFLAPDTLDEQIAIAEVLSDIDADLTAFESRRDKTRALKQAMMQELLTGNTRLPIAEPADV